MHNSQFTMHNSQCRMHNGVREVTLAFYVKELLYDIKNYAYIEGHILSDENVHAKHTTIEVGEDGNVDRVSRILSLCVSRCKEMLYPYTKEEIHSHRLTDKPRDNDCYYIELVLPREFSQTTLVLLEKQIHEYIVCSAVADWMSITNPGKAETWGIKAAEAEREINIIKNYRRRAVRRPLHPF